MSLNIVITWKSVCIFFLLSCSFIAILGTWKLLMCKFWKTRCVRSEPYGGALRSKNYHIYTIIFFTRYIFYWAILRTFTNYCTSIHLIKPNSIREMNFKSKTYTLQLRRLLNDIFYRNSDSLNGVF